MAKEITDYPSLETVNNMTQMELCRHYRFLRSPIGEKEISIMNQLVKLHKEAGGFTSEISKALGW